MNTTMSRDKEKAYFPIANEAAEMQINGLEGGWCEIK
jgi:hypothetical protein